VLFRHVPEERAVPIIKRPARTCRLCSWAGLGSRDSSAFQGRRVVRGITGTIAMCARWSSRRSVYNREQVVIDLTYTGPTPRDG